MSMRYRVIAVVLIALMIFQYLGQINGHTYAVGISNFHISPAPKGIICCFGPCGKLHAVYNCGQTFHLP
jgi:hypothetical protein